MVTEEAASQRTGKEHLIEAQFSDLKSASSPAQCLAGTLQQSTGHHRPLLFALLLRCNWVSDKGTVGVPHRCRWGAAPLVTQLQPFDPSNYYPGEDYHQDYYSQNPTQVGARTAFWGSLTSCCHHP